MIKDIKLCFKVYKYGLNLRTNIVCGLIFLVLGLVLDILTPQNPVGFMYVAMVGMMGQQTIQSVTVSSLVQSSPMKKRLETKLPAISFTLILFVANTLRLMIQLLSANLHHTDEGVIAGSIFVGCGMTLIIAFYMAAAMKLYWPATVAFFIIFMIYYGLTISVDNILDSGAVFDCPLGVAIAISYGVIVIAGFLMYLISLATYRLPYSKITWETQLKRASK